MEWQVVEIRRMEAKKVLAYITMRYGEFEFRNVRVLATPQGLVALFPGYALGRRSIPHVLIHSETLKHQLQETIRSALA